MTTSGTIVFVDDEKHVRLAGAQTLELAGHEVVALESAEAALKRLARERLGPAAPDVLVTDVRLPGMDGLALMQAVLRLDPDLPVVLVTGHGDVAMAVQAMRDGAYDFIEKPYPADRLAETVRRALDKRRLVLENRALRAAVAAPGASPILGRTPAVERLRATIAAVADTDADVLILGETGTGKELVARALHEQGPRRLHRFVALNCGAMPESLFESELFGHEAGAFTGALKRRTGRIEHASKGTLFLDEIESMPPSLQVKLLRVLQERSVEPLGGNEAVPVDLRVVAATKVGLRQAATEGRFREDLYYRLNVVVVTIPPLRERREDIPLLFQHFVIQAGARYQREAPALTPTHRHRLMSCRWPGNVRELRNAADRFVLGLDDTLELSTGELSTGELSTGELSNAEPSRRLTLAEQVDRFEKSVIEAELANRQGCVKTTLDALGVPRKTFYDKLRRHGISRADFTGDER